MAALYNPVERCTLTAADMSFVLCYEVLCDHTMKGNVQQQINIITIKQGLNLEIT